VGNIHNTTNGKTHTIALFTSPVFLSLKIWEYAGIGVHPILSNLLKYLKEICPRGNNNIVIIILLVHDNVYTPCKNCIKQKH
jgi:hypothetical protein